MSRMYWLKIEELDECDPEALVLAKTADGRMMIFRVRMLRDVLKTTTPNHLQFPATHFIAKVALDELPEQP